MCAGTLLLLHSAARALAPVRSLLAEETGFCCAVQGQGASASGGGKRDGDAGGSESDEELFVPRQRSSNAGAAVDAEDPEATDTVREALDAAHLAAWEEPGAAERLRDRFVTGVLPAVWLPHCQ